ncbi:MAG: N-acetylmuramoyl-L-alanine amidase [Lysobacterales bacterium 69-70]|nr:N-acetylmuramoyl-L-alanine amidase [Xanthomonadaceae bacterium]ODU31833.1 MAG: N-acetylmuramoyl-L-alanine amidase [Xanthomonadaceae bacterium SCN 69-320]ODV18851.1 MAG: N-acetylmuramoyl-L-alanine amidase [Xanthomonadaceae bacterium SCN 69-25]OJZ01558.1 MAG: N-acetylmuramoyl-L-alanine amidase [Xanthomonadales bacterium 69-70]
MWGAAVISFRAVAVLIVSGLAATCADAAQVKALRVWASPDSTRAVFDVSGPLEYKLFELSNPDRIVLDIKNSSLAEGVAAPAPKGLLGTVRLGKQGKSDLRVVFDLPQGVRPKSFLLPPADKFGHRLVIDLFPKTKATREVVKSVEDVLPGDGRKVIVAIDAGHGGDDPGAIGASGTHEKSITLNVAREVAKLVDAQPGMKAHLVRDGDYFIPLTDRYKKAREAKADLFVSIHADACPGACGARGASVWVLSPRGATSEAARWLAAKENGSDLVGGVSLDDKDDTLAAVLLDLSQGATMEASSAIAQIVLKALGKIGPTHRGYVEKANFVVLRSPDVPSILVETAFITNPAEEKRLTDPEHRNKLASAVVDGIKSYFMQTPPPGTWFAANSTGRRGPSEHVVARGETLSGIAARHRVSLGALREANRIAADGNVRVGDVLDIPPQG